MSYQGTEWARQIPGCNSGEKNVLAHIGHRLDQRTNNARISEPELARDTALCIRQVRRILRQLEKRNVLKKTGGGIGRSNVAMYSFVGFQFGEKEDIFKKRTFKNAKEDISAANPDMGTTAIRKEETTKKPQEETPGGKQKPKTRPPGCSSGYVVIDQRTFNSRQKDIAEKFCEWGGFPATRSFLEVIVGVLETIQAKHGFETCAQACEYLAKCVQGARKDYRSSRLQLKPRFFFEDGDYEQFNPDVLAEIEEELAKYRAQMAAKELAATPPEDIIGKCQGCGRPRLTSSTWGDYCALSCKAAHEKKPARRAVA